MGQQHRFALIPAAIVVLWCASYVCAASTYTASPAQHIYAKRDLSDSDYNRLAIIHASVGSAATMLIFPIGILGARGLRILTAKWWWAHAAVQGIFGLCCITAAFVLGVILTGPVDDFSPGHRQSGLVLFILVVVQSVFGLAIKLAAKTRLQDPSRVPAVKGHPIQNLVHAVLGLAIMGLGFWQTWSGFGLIAEASGGELVAPLVVYVIWGVIVGVVTTIYLLGLGLIPLQLRKEQERREAAPPFYHENDQKVLQTSSNIDRTSLNSSYEVNDPTSTEALRQRQHIQRFAR